MPELSVQALYDIRRVYDFKNDEVYRKKKLIYDRLRVADRWYATKNPDSQDKSGEFLGAFSEKQATLDRESLLEWLDEQDTITLKRKNRSRR